MKSETLAIKRLSDAKSKVSAHYFIKDNGKVINIVPDTILLGMLESLCGKVTIH